MDFATIRLEWFDAIARQQDSEFAPWLLCVSPEASVVVGGRVYCHKDIPGAAGYKDRGARKLEKDGTVYEIIGAGYITDDGTVSDWDSGGYRLDTPGDLMEGLQQFFRDHLEAIRQNW